MVKQFSRLQSKTPTFMSIPDLEAFPLSLQVGLQSIEPTIELSTTQPINLTMSEKSSGEGVKV